MLSLTTIASGLANFPILLATISDISFFKTSSSVVTPSFRITYANIPVERCQ